MASPRHAISFSLARVATVALATGVLSACDFDSGNWQKKPSTAQALSKEIPITYTKNASTTGISMPYSQRAVTPGRNNFV